MSTRVSLHRQAGHHDLLCPCRWVVRTLALGVLTSLVFVASLEAGDLRSAANQADYLVITPPLYRAQAERLAAFRHEHNGLRTMVVPIDTIVAQFTAVSTADSSIREFLDHALSQWTAPLPSAVVLVGNVDRMPSHCERELPIFIGFGHYDSVCVDQWFVEGAPDQWGGARMRCALGRLPGWDLAEITTMVDRVIAYETADPAPWWGRVIGLADYSADEGALFAEPLQEYQRTLATVWRDTVSVVLDTASAQYRDSTGFRQLWDEGAAMVIYSGHANAYNFSVMHYFTAETAALLRNGPRLPLFLSFGCELRYDLPDPTIAARLMSNPLGGAIASVVSAGVQFLSTGDETVRGIIQRLRDQPTLSAGAAFRQAKDSVGTPYPRRITYLGDPALCVRRPAQVASLDDAGGVPVCSVLEQNYPNPFNPMTAIRYQVSGSGTVRIAVYDVLGREVVVLVNEFKTPGTYQVRFDASGLASGVYLYRMTAGPFVETRKMLLVR